VGEEAKLCRGECEERDRTGRHRLKNTAGSVQWIMLEDHMHSLIPEHVTAQIMESCTLSRSAVTLTLRNPLLTCNVNLAMHVACSHLRLASVGPIDEPIVPVKLVRKLLISASSATFWASAR